jgi:opacity protein-like surface antigen
MNSSLLSPTSPVRSRGALLLATLLAALAAPCIAFADAAPADAATPAAEPARIRPLAGALLTGTIASDKSTVTNPDGSTTTGSLGGRYEVLAGAEFPIDPNGLALRLTLGMHTVSMSGTSERFTRFPLEASLWYPLNDKLRVGTGARYAARMRFSGAGNNTTDGLNATPSLLLLADYRVLPHVSIDMRYVYERFERTKGSDADGSHWGVGTTLIY